MNLGGLPAAQAHRRVGLVTSSGGETGNEAR